MKEPLSGEKIKTPDGVGTVIEAIPFKEDPKKENDNWVRFVKSRYGSDYLKGYYSVFVRFEDEDSNEEGKWYHCWEVERFDNNENSELPPWRRK